MNLGQIRERAQQRFRDSGGLLVGTTTWNEHINFSYRFFLRAARWPFLVESETVTVPASTRLVDLDALLTPPPDASTVLSSLENVYDTTNDHVLHPLPFDGMPWRLRLFIEKQQPGEPALFTVVGQNLYLIPPPEVQVDLRIYYFDDPPDMVANGDVPVVPDRFQEALVSGAVAKAHQDDQNREAANEYQQEFLAIIQQAIGELIMGQTESVQRMNVTGQPLPDTSLSRDVR